MSRQHRAGAESHLRRHQGDGQKGGAHEVRPVPMPPHDATGETEDRRGHHERPDPMGEMDGAWSVGETAPEQRPLIIDRIGS